jgi:hypothetical protein
MEARTFGTAGFAHRSTFGQALKKSATSDDLPSPAAFGSACALCQGMMPQFTETLEHSTQPQCSIEQARELLEALRSRYQSLGPAERGAVKGLIGQAQRKQVTHEVAEERECFESLS